MMKRDQQRYAMIRIDEALRDKLGDARATHTTPVKQPTAMQKREAIKRGAVGLKRHGWSLSTPIEDCYSFDGLQGEATTDEAAYRKEARKLRERASKVKDEIMLGDEAKALKLIREFCK